MADDTTDEPHVEEAHMADSLNNLVNAVTSDATKLTNLTFSNANLVEQLKVGLSQNKVLADLLSKNICGVTATQSENQNANKQKRTDKTKRHKNLKIT